MSLSGLAVRRPLAVAAVNVALLILGVFALLRMPVSLFPEVRLPFVTVRVAMPGATATQVETLVAKVLEPEFAKISGVSRQITFARPHGVEFVLGFRFGVPQIEALNGVRMVLDRMESRLPSSAGRPEIRAVDPAQTPIVIEVLERQINEEDSRDLLSALRSLPGVASVELTGQSPKQLWFRLGLDRVQEAGVAPLEVFQSLAQQSVAVPWGDASISQVGEKPSSRVPVWAQTKTPEAVLLRDRRVVPLAELGVFRQEEPEDAAKVWVAGRDQEIALPGFLAQPSVAVWVYKRADANTVEVATKVHETLEAWRSPRQLTSFTALDQSSYIRENAREVWLALIWGGLLAMVTVAVFLRDVRSGFITGTALPVSICGTFLIISGLGFSLNMLTLLALSLAVGLLIDDAVIVRESISRELERGLDPRRAALRGTARVFAPVVATTLCVAAVFFPVAMMSGVVGQFFREFGLTICVAVCLSAFVAFTLDPMLSAYFSKSHRSEAADQRKGSQPSIPLKTPRGTHRPSRGLRTVLALSDGCYRRPGPVIFLSVALFGVAVLLAVRSGVDFMSSEDKDQVLVDVLFRPGSAPADRQEWAARLAHKAQEIPGVRQAVSFVGNSADPSRAQMRVILEPKKMRGKSASHLVIAHSLRKELAEVVSQGVSEGEDPRVHVLVREPPPVEGVGGEPPLSLYLYGDAMEGMHAQAQELAKALARIPGTGSVMVDTAGMGDELAAEVDAVRALAAGVDPAHLMLTGRLMLSGVSTRVAQGLGGGGPEIWVGIDGRGPSATSTAGNANGADMGSPGGPQSGGFSLDALSQMVVPTPQGRVPVGELLTLVPRREPQALDRENGVRKVVIYGAPDGTRALSQVLAEWQKAASKVSAPFRAEIGGDREIFEEMLSHFSMALVGGVLFVFVILIALYESLWLPVIVLFTLPLAALGGLLSLEMSGDRLAMGSLIGFVLLIGISAKNAILIVDSVKRDVGRWGGRMAVLVAVRSRMRPILMTSIALAIGMLPTVFLRGSGSEFRAPMALSIIGGIVSSTLLSFLVIPAIFGWAERWGLVEALRRRERLRMSAHAESEAGPR